MKRIVFYFDSMAAAGGVERVIAMLTDRLSSYYDVTILTTDEAESFYELNGNVKLDVLKTKRVLNMNENKLKRIIDILRSILGNRKELKSKLAEFDYVYVASPLTALEMFLLGKTYRKKTVVSEHASYYATNSIYQSIRKYIYPKMEVISVPNKMDTELYNQNGCNAVYIPHLTTYNVNKELSKENIVLNVGRLTNDKQQDKLLDIWTKIVRDKEIQNWQLYIVGSGELEAQLIDKIKEEKLEKYVKLIAPTPDIAEYYRMAKVFAFTSKMEGFGMVLLEAMAYGLPCVSFDCPSGPRDVIKEDYNGFLVKCYDTDEYAEKLYTIISSDEIYSRLQKGSYDFIENIDENNIINEWKKLFK